MKRRVIALVVVLGAAGGGAALAVASDTPGHSTASMDALCRLRTIPTVHPTTPAGIRALCSGPDAVAP